jgi:hypothetical protein
LQQQLDYVMGEKTVVDEIGMLRKEIEELSFENS